MFKYTPKYENLQVFYYFISVFCAAVIILSCFCMPAYALTANEGQAALDSAFNAMFATVAGDVNKDGSFNAADARAALLASAGLVDDVDMDAGDIDGDTVVTAIDARMLLRISAQLEPEATNEMKFVADVTGDGKVEAKDARRILRVSAQLDKEADFGKDI